MGQKCFCTHSRAVLSKLKLIQLRTNAYSRNNNPPKINTHSAQSAFALGPGIKIVAPNTFRTIASARPQNVSFRAMGTDETSQLPKCERVTAGMPIRIMTSNTQLTVLIKNFCTTRQGGAAPPHLIHLLGDFVLKHPFYHPAHGEQIVEGREQPVPYAVMRLAAGAGIMADGDFGDGKSFDLEERGQEPVHSLEKLQVGDALAFEGAITAAGVGDILPGKLIADPVGDAR